MEDLYTLYRRMMDTWHEAMKQGPDACQRLLSRIEETRDKDRAHMDAVASDVRDINREVVAELGGLDDCSRGLQRRGVAHSGQAREPRPPRGSPTAVTPSPRA